MPLQRAVENHDYWPEFGTFVIRDVAQPGRRRPQVGELLAEYAVDAQPCGSIARAGDGWLDGGAADSHHTVRLEVHDTAPGHDEPLDWTDLVDLPFASAGVISLALVVGGATGEPLELGPAGLYRVRFARRAATAGADPRGYPCEYQLRFWPTGTSAEPPRWLRRSSPFIGERNDFDGAYRQATSDVLMLVLWAAETATPVTLKWLADRLLTTTTTVREILEHPRPDVLTAGGSLDDENAPLTVTVHPRKPRPVRTTGLPTIPGTTRGTPAARSSSAARSGAAARPRAAVRRVAARPAVPRQHTDPDGQQQSDNDPEQRD
jgi:hypothetical protein